MKYSDVQHAIITSSSWVWKSSSPNNEDLLKSFSLYWKKKYGNYETFL